MRQTQFTMRHYENVHIPLWLLKDTCWMLEWKWLGMAMIFPTIGVAAYIAIKSAGHRQMWLNWAICFWIAANAYWMSAEFVEREDLKLYAGIPFGMGFLFTAIFYVTRDKERSQDA